MANFLVVDDDALVRKLVESVLKKLGHSFVSASDTLDALKIMEAEAFDLIVCDINMPGYNGYSLVQTIRKDDKFKEIPVLFLSGRREKKDVERALDAGGDDYLIKPLDFDLFSAKVGSLLKDRHERHGFAETVTDKRAVWTLHFKVFGLSEQGLSFRSLLPLPVNLKFKIECDIFKEIGIAPPSLRVAICTQENGADDFLVKASFLGLTSGELQLIRQWAMSSHSHSGRRTS